MPDQTENQPAKKDHWSSQVYPERLQQFRLFFFFFSGGSMAHYSPVRHIPLQHPSCRS